MVKVAPLYHGLRPAGARVIVEIPKHLVPGAGIEPARPFQDPGF